MLIPRTERELRATVTFSDPVDAGDVQFDHNLLGTNEDTPFSDTGSSPNARGNLIGSASSLLDPGLSPLVDFGILKVHGLNSDSPAIDIGSNLRNLSSDQIGAARQRGAGVDIGAIEGAIGGLVVSSPSVNEGQDGTTSLTFTVRLLADASSFTVDVDTADGTGTAGDGDVLRSR